MKLVSTTLSQCGNLSNEPKEFTQLPTPTHQHTQRSLARSVAYSSGATSRRTSESSFLGGRTLSVTSSHTSYSSVQESPCTPKKDLHYATQMRIEQDEPKKRYFCTHCPDTFTYKLDWKTHELRYHERQFQYICPECKRETFTEFSFKTHIREMHGCKKYPHIKSVARKVQASKRRTAWGCGICSALLLDWEKRCDHVAMHCEAGSRREEWTHSKVIIGLLRQPLFDSAWRSYLIERHGNYPNSNFGVCWRTTATGRSSNGSRKLQDWLEMGNAERDVEFIINLAYRHGHRFIQKESASTNVGDWTANNISVRNHEVLSHRLLVSQSSKDVDETLSSLMTSEIDESMSEDETEDCETRSSSSESDGSALVEFDASLSDFYDQMNQKLVNDLMCEVWSLLDHRPSNIQSVGDAQGSENHSTSPPPPKTTHTGLEVSRKRQRRSSGNSRYPQDSGDDDDEVPSKWPSSVPKDSQVLGARFACPYYQRNPQRHKSRSCAGPGWRTVHRVK
jgi:hypothetical protein